MSQVTLVDDIALNDDLLSRIDSALTKIKTDGRYRKIHDRWFGAGG